VVLDAAPGTLRLEELATPRPGPGEVLVEVAACGVCHTDLHVVKGEVAFPTPCVLGHEVSGVVRQIGAGVTGLAPGERVVSSFIMPCGTCRHCVRGHDDICETFFAQNRLNGTLYDGRTRLARRDGSPVWMYSMAGLAEYCVVPATAVFRVPETMSIVDAAIFGCSAFTAYGALHNVARLRLGETVAVVAVGGVGSTIVQLARAMGAPVVIAVDRGEDKLKAAAALGATQVLDARTEDVAARVADITGGLGVDIAFEVLGRAETFELALSLLGDGGRAVMVGIAPAGVTGRVDITRLVRRTLRILGSYGARARTDMPALLRLAAQGVVRPADVITRRYALEDAPEAYAALDRGEIVGRAVVDVRHMT
jgi:S-(hydroxymethyl)glutathione dehydrogenase/alcohol dehydrogenase